MANYLPRHECLIPCELEHRIAALRTGDEEPWLCRRIAEASSRRSGGDYTSICFTMRSEAPGGRTGRSEENLIFFIMSFVFLVLRTLSVPSPARANSSPLTKA